MASSLETIAAAKRTAVEWFVELEFYPAYANFACIESTTGTIKKFVTVIARTSTNILTDQELCKVYVDCESAPIAGWPRAIAARSQFTLTPRGSLYTILYAIHVCIHPARLVSFQHVCTWYFESMTSYQKSDSENRCMFTRRTIVLNFIAMRSETTET